MGFKYQIEGESALAIKEFEKTGITYTKHAEDFAVAIVDDDTYFAADHFLSQIKARRKELSATIKTIKDPAFAAWKGICALETKGDEPLAKAEAVLKNALVAYHEKQKREQAAQEAKLVLEQKKLAEEEQKTRIEAAMKAGDEEAATAILNEPPPPPIIPVVAAIASKQGATNFSEKWHASVDEDKFMEFLKAVVDGKIPRTAVLVNDAFLNNQARVLKGNLNWPPCVRVWKTTEAATRAAK